MDQLPLQADECFRTITGMAVFVIFLLGIGNFALHSAVMESRNALLKEVPWLAGPHGKRIAFGAEFAVLLAAMLLVADGWGGLAWAYLVYSAVNGVSAWLILTGRV